MTSPMPDLLEHVVNGPKAHELELDGSKVKWYGDRIRAWERGEKIAPITMDVAWTRKCQYSCEFCYAQLQANEGGEITRDIAFQYLEDAAEIGVRGVSLISDGESTIVPFYADSIIHGHKVGLAIGVGTNGQKLRKSLLEKILPHISYLRFNFSAGERKRYAQIMGVKEAWYDVVIQNIKDAMEIKRRDNLPVTINCQMVCDPKYEDQIIPFAELVCSLRPDYGIIKHCADDVLGSLGTDYSKYEALTDKFRTAESMGDEEMPIVVKWNRLKNEGKREYSRCLGPPFITQLSGSGLMAPCGFLFNKRYAAFHIGWITDRVEEDGTITPGQRFRDIFQSDRYWEVMRYLASDEWDARKRCGPQCLQTLTNDFLFKYQNGEVQLPPEGAVPPKHLEFL